MERPPYHRENLEEQLIEAAAQIVATRGVEALSLRELGRAAAVSRTAPYHYFADKAQLLARVGERGFERLVGTLLAAVEGITAPRERALAGFRAYVRFAQQEPAFFRLMFADVLVRSRTAPPDAAAAGHAFSSPAAQQAFGLLVQAVAELRGEPLPQALRHAHVVWAFVHGVAVLVLDRNLKDDATAVLEAGLQALLGDPGADPPG